MGVGTQINRLKKAKKSIIQSIVRKGVQVPQDTKADLLSTFIDQIKQTGYDTSDSNALPSDIREGVKVYTKDGAIIGTHKDINMQDSTVTSQDIKEGKIAYGKEGKIIGTSKAGDGIEAPDVTENDIVLNKIGYGANGVIHGRKQFSTYYTGNAVPNKSLGIDGDLYFKKA